MSSNRRIGDLPPYVQRAFLDLFALMEEEEERGRTDLTEHALRLDAVMDQLARAANEVNDEELDNVAHWVNAVSAMAEIVETTHAVAVKYGFAEAS